MTELVVDASIFIAAFRRGEGGHKAARRLLNQCMDEEYQFTEPAHLVAELLGALVRTGSSAANAQRLVSNYRSRTRLGLEPITLSLAETAGDIAALQKIRGSDALYISIARAYDIPLVTLDREQRERAPVDVEVFTPEEALAKWWPE